MEAMRWIVSCTFLSIVSLLVAVILISNFFVVTDFDDVTVTWKAEPIVSVYVPSNFLDSNCKTDYEPILAYNTLKGFSNGPCGCAKNLQGTLSSTAPCNANQEKDFACMSLNSLPEVNTMSWHSSVMCIKRDGQAATTNHRKYHDRPHPDKHGQCPDGYKKCGMGRSHQEGAICFPSKAECPITNLLILPSNEAPSEDNRWEPAGVFADNHTLFVRREFPNELPITAITFRLTELSHKGTGYNKRGHCYEDRIFEIGQERQSTQADQIVNNTVVADPSKLWSYYTALPPACKATDPRFTLVDQMPLQDHFLQNLQFTLPICKSFPLYPLSDPRYQPARDPDYLNSGVKCGSAPYYKCVRDPYQPTNCAAGDDICDGVVNQNVCGAYAHAVRSAFSDYKSKGVTLGMYIAREVQWTDECTAVKENLYWGWVCFEMFVLKFIMLQYWFMYCAFSGAPRHRKVLFIYNSVGFPVMMVMLYLLALVVAQMCDVYDAVESRECTDSFTRDTILDRLEPMKTTHDYIVLTILILLLMTIDAVIMRCIMSQSHRWVQAAGDTGEWSLERLDVATGAIASEYRAVATVEDTPTLAVAVPAYQPPTHLNGTDETSSVLPATVEELPKIASAPSTHMDVSVMVENGLELIDLSAGNV